MRTRKLNGTTKQKQFQQILMKRKQPAKGFFFFFVLLAFLLIIIAVLPFQLTNIKLNEITN